MCVHSTWPLSMYSGETGQTGGLDTDQRTGRDGIGFLVETERISLPQGRHVPVCKQPLVPGRDRSVFASSSGDNDPEGTSTRSLPHILTQRGYDILLEHQR